MKDPSTWRERVPRLGCAARSAISESPSGSTSLPSTPLAGTLSVWPAVAWKLSGSALGTPFSEVICRLHPPVKRLVLLLKLSSRTNRLQVPFGLLPLKMPSSAPLAGFLVGAGGELKESPMSKLVG